VRRCAKPNRLTASTAAAESVGVGPSLFAVGRQADRGGHSGAAPKEPPQPQPPGAPGLIGAPGIARVRDGGGAVLIASRVTRGRCGRRRNPSTPSTQGRGVRTHAPPSRRPTARSRAQRRTCLRGCTCGTEGYSRVLKGYSKVANAHSRKVRAVVLAHESLTRAAARPHGSIASGTRSTVASAKRRAGRAALLEGGARRARLAVEVDRERRGLEREDVRLGTAPVPTAAG
jgi:hypothetical protein